MRKYRIINKIKRGVDIFKTNVKQIIFYKTLKKDKKDKIIFVIPNINVISGGVLSIFHMYKISKELFPQKSVYIGVFSKYQKVTNISDSKSNIDIINIKFFLNRWINQNDKILFHVYENGVLDFVNGLKTMNIMKFVTNTTINILNQNQNLMPQIDEIYSIRKYFSRLTMTLAFKSNDENLYPFLSFPPFFVGAFFDGNDSKRIPFSKKENLCILSFDNNEFKEEIKQKLVKNNIKCFDSYPIPFTEFNLLQQRAKWTISFGEGLDGYSLGQFRNGGIGFGVYQENFKQTYIDPSNLPKFLFKNYKEMSMKILEVIKYYDNDDIFSETNKKWLDIINSNPFSNDPYKIKMRWINYYKKVDYLK